LVYQLRQREERQEDKEGLVLDKDAVEAIILTLFMAGGPVVAWIQTRAANKKEITPKEVEETVVAKAAEDLGIADRWKSYADDVEQRLDQRVKELEESLTSTRQSKDRVMAYASVLRSHIQKQEPPPPPPWPSNID
jgi:hypothetical protein